ncbi:MAG: di-heme oxidoredictase family protein [Gemmatales bacterium]
MFQWKLQDSRRYTAWGLGVLAVIGLVWWLSPGMPVIIGPWAWSGQAERGQELFAHEWTAHDPFAGGDGLGPVFNATSCASCHFQGGLGGAGETRGDVRHYMVRETRQNPSADGMIHAGSVSKEFQESFSLLRTLYPVLKGSTRRERTGHCEYTVTIPDFDPVRVESINATALFGAGWIDLISSKAIKHQQFSQTFSGTWVELTKAQFDIKPLGKARILSDGRVGKFGWKAQFATLEEFVASACANELGLSTPIKDQPRPMGNATYVSTGVDMSWRQLRDMSAFVSTLPRPVEVLPAESDLAALAVQGKKLFKSVGCASCHVPDLGGVSGVYSDFLLHDVISRLDGSGGGGGGGGYGGDPEPADLPERSPGEPLPNEWKTPPLWGVASSAPYMHDGSAKTLEIAILQHKGDATVVTQAYRKLSKDDQRAVVEFLKTLQAPGNVPPASPAPVVKPGMVAQR